MSAEWGEEYKHILRRWCVCVGGGGEGVSKGGEPVASRACVCGFGLRKGRPVASSPRQPSAWTHKPAVSNSHRLLLNMQIVCSTPFLDEAPASVHNQPTCTAAAVCCPATSRVTANSCCGCCWLCVCLRSGAPLIYKLHSRHSIQ